LRIQIKHIFSHIIDHMRMHALEARVQDILTKDYHGMARDILNRRQSGQESGPVSLYFLIPQFDLTVVWQWFTL